MLEEEGLNYLFVPSVENITKLSLYEEVIKEYAAKNVGKKLINKNKNLGFYDTCQLLKIYSSWSFIFSF